MLTVLWVLQMALEESKKEGSDSVKLPKKKKEPAVPVDPWGGPPSVPPMKSNDPWASNSTPASDPWSSSAARPKTSNTGSFDLFNASNGTSKEDFSEFDSLRSSSCVPTASPVPSQVPLASSNSLDLFDPLPTSIPVTTNPTRKTPESFLGPNAALVNLDSLVTKPTQAATAVNPFLASTGGSAPAAHANPFQVSQPVPPTLNQMRVSPMPASFGSMAEPITLSSMPAQPITMVPLAGMAPMGRAVAGIPAGTQPTGTTNPFLL
uniref:Uncharacterized protein n=1 Tax=Mola mola TaxID=94237 RepID=A0A3Q3WG80_MOLML